MDGTVPHLVTVVTFQPIDFEDKSQQKPSGPILESVNCITILSLSAPLVWFWKLFLWSFELIYTWPFLLVDLVLAINLAAATALKWPFRRDRWRPEYWLVFISLLFVPATAAIGAIGGVAVDPTKPLHPNTPALWICNAMLIASVLLAIFWTYRMKGVRWFAVSFALMQLWLLFGVGFIAAMALTGDWL
ncbi:MAG: hypothetical protein WBQ34_02225 [Candidatus Acidiferrales bacterium]